MEKGLRKVIRSYRDLIVWQAAMDLVIATYEGTRPLPADERFGLVSQMRRAAVSVAANIAEGHGRRSTGDYIRFLAIARGSLMELETHFLVCERLGFIDSAFVAIQLERTTAASRMLSALSRSLGRRSSLLAPRSSIP